MVEHERRPGVVVEDHRARRGCAGQTLADAHDREALGDVVPVVGPGVERGDHEPVGSLLAQLLQLGPLTVRVAVGVRDHGVAAAGEQRPGQVGGEPLLPQVAGGPAQHAHGARGAGREGPRDGVGVVAEPRGRRPDPLDRGVRAPLTAQGVGRGRRRDARPVATSLQGRALRHAPSLGAPRRSVTCVAAGRWRLDGTCGLASPRPSRAAGGRGAVVGRAPTSSGAGGAASGPGAGPRADRGRRPAGDGSGAHARELTRVE